MQQQNHNNCQKSLRSGYWHLFRTLAGLLLAVCSVTAGIGLFSAVTPASSPDLVVPPTLKLGSRGTDVSKLQAALKLLGYYQGEVDGIYGETTVESVLKFQQAAGLRADGIAGETTWKRLFPTHSIASTPSPSPSPSPTPSPSSNPPTPNPSPSPTPKPSPSSIPITTPQPEAALPANADLPTLRLGMRGAAVSALQQRLKTLGLFFGNVDGVFGAKTELAVKQAQKKFKITADGIVGKTTWAAILR